MNMRMTGGVTAPRILLVVSLSALFWLSPASTSYAHEAVVRYAINARPMADALQDFAEQSKLQIIYSADMVETLAAPTLYGEHSPSDALRILLDGTELKFYWANNKTIAITREGFALNGHTFPQDTALLGEAIAIPSFDQWNAERQREYEQLLAAKSRIKNRYIYDNVGERDPYSEIIITGSRIARTGLVSPTPTTVLTAEAMEVSGTVNLLDIINELPAVGPGLSTSNTNFTFTSAGLNILNLRNLGTQRTAVLVDGRRHVGSLVGTSAVDVGTIPTALIDRVEVITGGASAVYGSDAVSGVVNFILKRDFKGFRLDAQIGTALEGSGEEYSFSATAGDSLWDGRGHFVLNFTASENKGVAAWKRDFARRGLEFLPNPANTGPNDGIPDLISLADIRNVEAAVSGAVRLPADVMTLRRDNSVSNLFTFDAGGQLRPFDYGQGIVGENRHLGDGDGDNVSVRDLLSVPLRRFIVSGLTRYDLTEEHRLIFDAKFARMESRASFQPVFDFQSFAEADGLGIVLSADNPFIQDDLRAILRGDPTTTADDIESITLSRTNLEFGNRGQDVRRDTLRFVTGISGPLVRDWSFDLHYLYGRTNSTIIKLNDRIQDRFEQSLDAVRDPQSGEIRCRNPADGCVPFNPLGPPGTASPDAVAFSRVDTKFTQFLEQQVVGAVIDGEMIQLPAGSVEIVLGAEYRKEWSDLQSPEVSQLGQGFLRTVLGPVRGGYNVKEAFAETIIPLIRDASFVRELNLEAAIRWADYSTSGSSISWKLGGDWIPSDDIRFRAIFAAAVRAPNITELFQQGTQGFPRLDDPCDKLFVNDSPNRANNCAALGVPSDFTPNNREVGQRTTVVGNTDLDEERAKTKTLGVVLTPPSLHNFRLTLDYWSIKIDDAITSFPAQIILDHCVDAPSVDNFFCRAIMRGPDGNVQNVIAQYINVSQFKTAGLDLEVDYRLELESLGAPGSVRLNLLGSYVDKLTVFMPPSVVDEQAGEIGIPKWRARGTMIYGDGPFTFALQQKYVGSTVKDVRDSVELHSPHSTGSEWYTDIQARYQLRDNLSIYAGINNLFNNIPPQHPDTFQGGTTIAPNSIVYDSIGHFIYAGISLRFNDL